MVAESWKGLNHCAGQHVGVGAVRVADSFIEFFVCTPLASKDGTAGYGFFVNGAKCVFGSTTDAVVEPANVVPTVMRVQGNQTGKRGGMTIMTSALNFK